MGQIKNIKLHIVTDIKNIRQFQPHSFKSVLEMCIQRFRGIGGHHMQ